MRHSPIPIGTIVTKGADWHWPESQRNGSMYGVVVDGGGLSRHDGIPDTAVFVRWGGPSSGRYWYNTGEGQEDVRTLTPEEHERYDALFNNPVSAPKAVLEFEEI